MVELGRDRDQQGRCIPFANPEVYQDGATAALVAGRESAPPSFGAGQGVPV
ncbi:MAG: hypothetical protein AAGJ40_06165 [Planctomycetota bacterium]